MSFCSKCGSKLNVNAVFCGKCGTRTVGEVVHETVQTTPQVIAAPVTKTWFSTLFLCWILGIFGVHRFYTGHVASGIIQLLTGGGFGIWTFIDWIMILTNKFKDKTGNLIVRKTGEGKKVWIIVGAFLVISIIIGVVLVNLLSSSSNTGSSSSISMSDYMACASGNEEACSKVIASMNGMDPETKKNNLEKLCLKYSCELACQELQNESLGNSSSVKSRPSSTPVTEHVNNQQSLLDGVYDGSAINQESGDLGGSIITISKSESGLSAKWEQYQGSSTPKTIGVNIPVIISGNAVSFVISGNEWKGTFNDSSLIGLDGTVYWKQKS